LGLDLTVDAMDVARGQGRAIEQRLARHAVIAAGTIGRHASLIAPEDVHARPIHLIQERRARQFGVHASRGFATGEGYRKPPARGDGSGCQRDEMLRPRPRQGLGIANDLNLHHPCPKRASSARHCTRDGSLRADYP